MSVVERHINEITGVALFFVWLLLFSIVKFTHVVANNSNSIVLITTVLHGMIVPRFINPVCCFEGIGRLYVG